MGVASEWIVAKIAAKRVQFSGFSRVRKALALVTPIPIAGGVVASGLSAANNMWALAVAELAVAAVSTCSTMYAWRNRNPRALGHD